MSERKLVIIDGHSLLYRAYFALPPMSDQQGRPTNALLGLLSMLFSVLQEQKPQYALAAFDLHGPTFRNDLSDDYKANRQAMPQDLVPQVDYAIQVVSALGLEVIQQEGFEADDIIGSICRNAADAGFLVTVVTGDHDALQLVSDQVSVLITRRGVRDTVLYDRAAVIARYGFPPELVPDYKALRGDASDNIAGVPGIGEKMATQLLQQYGGVDAILSQLPEMPPGRVRHLLEEHRSGIARDRTLATIVTDVPLSVELEKALWQERQSPSVRELLESFALRSLAARLPQLMVRNGGKPAGEAAASSDASSIASPLPVRRAALQEELEETLALAREQGVLVVRSVFEGPPLTAPVAGLVLADRSGSHPAYVEGTDGASIALVGALLADPDIAVQGYDLKREVLAWGRLGVTVTNCSFDAMLAAYLTAPRGRALTLDVLAAELCQEQLPPEDGYLGAVRRRGASLDPDAMATYWCRWIELFALVRDALSLRLEERELVALFDGMEMPLIPVLARMEQHGVVVDTIWLAELGKRMARRIAELEEEAERAAGEKINLGSPQQLAGLLYDRLGLAAGRKNKTGRSTDADTLEALREMHPVVGLVLEWRQLTKLKGTYVDALLELTDETGRVHTSFNQAVAATGRLSSSDPNLQNIPVRGEWGPMVRRAFRAPLQQRLVAADYSQIELRILAHFSRDEQLVAAFANHEDIHRRTAALVYGVPQEAVTAEMRRHAKAVNFGIIYGLSEYGLSRDTGMSRPDAKAFITQYMTLFHGIVAYLDGVREKARKEGYASTLFGRRRYLPDINSSNWQLRGAAERMAINMPLQGTAADLMKRAMLNVDAALAARSSPATVILQVHDELVLEVPEDAVEGTASLLVSSMMAAGELSVPLEVDVKAGVVWSEMTPLEVGVAATGADA